MFSAHYDSIEELIKATNRTPVNPDNAAMINFWGSAGWWCADRPTITTVKQGLAALQSGTFQPGVDRLERLSSLITVPDPVGIRRKIVRGDHGDELSMERVWQGDLDNAWSRAARQSVPTVSRVIIGVAVDAACSVSSIAMAWRGVAALALCDALEKAGYTCEVRALSSDDYYYDKAGEDDRHDVSVTIKAVGQPLDIHKAASLVTSSILYRACIIPHATAHAPRKVRQGHTRPSGHRIAPPNEPGYDYACLVTSAVSSQDTAQRWVSNQVEAITRKQKGE